MTDYAVNVKKTKNNHPETQLSAPLLITCLLEEGNITVADAESAQYRSRMNSEDLYTFATPAAIGDKVQIAATDTAYTHANCHGMPIVAKYAAANTTPMIGEIVGYPMPLLSKPATSVAANSPAKRVVGANGNPYLRTVLVKVFAMEYEVLTIVGAINAGAFVGYDYGVGVAGYQTFATITKALCCHYSAAGGSCGVLKWGPIFLHET
jgi:hypothetical protein